MLANYLFFPIFSISACKTPIPASSSISISFLLFSLTLSFTGKYKNGYRTQTQNPIFFSRSSSRDLHGRRLFTCGRLVCAGCSRLSNDDDQHDYDYEGDRRWSGEKTRRRSWMQKIASFINCVASVNSRALDLDFPESYSSNSTALRSFKNRRNLLVDQKGKISRTTGLWWRICKLLHN